VKAFVHAATLILVTQSAACGAITGDESADDALTVDSISVSVSPTGVIAVARGQTTTFSVTLTRFNHTADVSLSAIGLPSGVTATFNPSTLSGSRLTSTLTVAVALDAALGPQSFIVHALGFVVGADAGVQLSVFSPSAQVTVTRAGSGSGTVTSDPSGINCGNACTASFTAVPSVTLTATPASGSAFGGWSGACTGSAATCTFSTSNPAQYRVTATFNSTTPSFSLAVTPPSFSVQQGGSGSATVNVTREGGFSAAVNLAFSGAPNGLTITANPASVTGASATLTFAAALSLPTGNYPITITGTGTGVAQRTASVQVLVTPTSGGSNNVAMSFAKCDPTLVPIWFAVQNGSGPWTRVNAGAGSTFSFTVGANTGVAYVTHAGPGYETVVQYGSAAEMMVPTDPCSFSFQTGTKQLTGTAVGLGLPGGGYWMVTLGGAFLQRDPAQGGGFTLTSVAAGPRDLVAGRVLRNSPDLTTLQRMIVRRDVDYPNNSAIPLLDFGGSESFMPVTVFLRIDNLDGNQSQLFEALVTPRGRTEDFYSALPGGPGGNHRYFALPASQTQAGEFHLVTIAAAPPGENPTSFRFTQLLLQAPSDRTMSLGPEMSSPTVTSLGGTPLRLRAQVASQGAYAGAVQVQYEQPDRSLDLFATAAYSGGTPATWSLDVPDLSAAGYDPAWGLHGGSVDWGVFVLGGDLQFFSGAPLTGDAQILGAGRGSSLAALSESAWKAPPGRIPLPTLPARRGP
jgi:hypothetical protein